MNSEHDIFNLCDLSYVWGKSTKICLKFHQIYFKLFSKCAWLLNHEPLQSVNQLWLRRRIIFTSVQIVKQTFFF